METKNTSKGDRFNILSPILKNLGTALITLFLIFIITWSFTLLMRNVGIPPNAVKVGDVVERFSAFDRAKDIFLIIFPLFGALTSFWFGYKLQEGKVEKAQEKAEKSEEEAKKSENEAKRKEEEAYQKLSQIRARADSIRDVLQVNTSGFYSIPKDYKDDISSKMIDIQNVQDGVSLLQKSDYLHNQKFVLNQINQIKEIARDFEVQNVRRIFKINNPQSKIKIGVDYQGDIQKWMINTNIILENDIENISDPKGEIEVEANKLKGKVIRITTFIEFEKHHNDRTIIPKISIEENAQNTYRFEVDKSIDNILNYNQSLIYYEIMIKFE